MKDEVEVVTREWSSITLPEKCVEWLEKRVEAGICFSESRVIEVKILWVMKGEKEGLDYERD